MGYLQGYLMKYELNDMIPKFYSWLEYYLDNNVSSTISKLPTFVKKFFVNPIGMGAFKIGLDLTYEITKPYTP